MGLAFLVAVAQSVALHACISSLRMDNHCRIYTTSGRFVTLNKYNYSFTFSFSFFEMQLCSFVVL